MSALLCSVFAAVLFGFSGCAGKKCNICAPLITKPTDYYIDTEAFSGKTEALKNDLLSLHNLINPAEAEKIAKEALTTSAYLTETYNPVWPPFLNNLLINLGFKERGLCFHWTMDMINNMLALKLTTYQLHWGVAHCGSDLWEHNSLVITAKGQAFEEGIVMDPWRKSGDLYWTKITKDSYPWQKRGSISTLATHLKYLSCP